MKGIEKLPKWAQLEIKIMENKLVSIRKELSQLYGEEETNTSIVKISSNKPLPINANNNVITCGIYEDTLRVYGKDTIIVLPRAANSIHIK